ncbi:MAG: DUF3822 family protein [Flavitalea sp.]
MIQPAFDIGNPETLPELDGNLLVEISGQSFNYILFTKDPYRLILLRQYRLYTTNDKMVRDILEEIISGDTVLQQYAKRAIVIYNFPEANILPEEYVNEQLNTPLNKLFFGESDNGFLFNEKVRDWNLQNVYSVPKDIHSLFKEKFTGSSYWHFYSLLLGASKKEVVEKVNYIRVVFYHDKFIAAFFIGGQLQLIQTFNYQTPEDVAYYLLLICKQFNQKQQDVSLNISGLIDSQSALYTELFKYFEDLQEDVVPLDMDTNDLLNELPAHYFSPLLKMSVCGL